MSNKRSMRGKLSHLEVREDKKWWWLWGMWVCYNLSMKNNIFGDKNVLKVRVEIRQK